MTSQVGSPVGANSQVGSDWTATGLLSQVGSASTEEAGWLSQVGSPLAIAPKAAATAKAQSTRTILLMDDLHLF
ncbi:predicted protein [Streptomyces albidoflavus]|nr:predicted protein [Streptomyces albidoflavus]